MANHARGEADIAIAGKTYPVRMSLGALARIASAVNVQGMKELNDRILAFNLSDMPAIIDAILKGNGHDVPMADIEAMDPMVYLNEVIPAFFRRDDDAKPAAGNGAARPPKRPKTPA